MLCLPCGYIVLILFGLQHLILGCPHTWIPYPPHLTWDPAFSSGPPPWGCFPYPAQLWHPTLDHPHAKTLYPAWFLTLITGLLLYLSNLLTLLELWHQAPSFTHVWVPASLCLGYRTVLWAAHKGGCPLLTLLGLRLPMPGRCPIWTHCPLWALTHCTRLASFPHNVPPRTPDLWLWNPTPGHSSAQTPIFL